jgi:hypothetical protein
VEGERRQPQLREFNRNPKQNCLSVSNQEEYR